MTDTDLKQDIPETVTFPTAEKEYERTVTHLTLEEKEALRWLLDRQLATSSFSDKGWMELLRGIRDKLGTV